jgi:hypothetical protein
MSSITDPSIKNVADSGKEVREFFDKYYTKKISFTSNQVDSVVGFFKKRGFETAAATSVATVILQQAKIDKVNVYKILDTLEGLTEIQLSKLVATILNNNRSKISKLGTSKISTGTTLEQRNIVV